MLNLVAKWIKLIFQLKILFTIAYDEHIISKVCFLGIYHNVFGSTWKCQ